jgi:hypothetical protein
MDRMGWSEMLEDLSVNVAFQKMESPQLRPREYVVRVSATERNQSQVGQLAGLESKCVHPRQAVANQSEPVTSMSRADR